MQKLKNYYERFFGMDNTSTNQEFVTRLGDDWAEKYPKITGLSAFALRILKALLLGQKVCIFADYDTDAVSATAVLYWSLIEMGFEKDKLGYYAPDRFSESYGLNLPALKVLAEDYDLIITVDCGITATEEAEYMQSAKADLVITDHHQIKEGLPFAQVALNPQIEVLLAKKPSKKWQKNQVANEEEMLLSMRNYIDDQAYVELKSRIEKTSTNPWPTSLVGAGVIWILMVGTQYMINSMLKSGILRGISKEHKTSLSKCTPKKLEKLLGFVAIATIADCQSIIDPLNRSLVQIGLKYLNTGTLPYPGLEQLLVKTGLKAKMEQGYQLNSQDLGFTLSPVLNASGRISHASLALDAMTAWKQSTAEELADRLVDTNQKRKEMVSKAMSEINTMVAEQVKNHQPFLVLSGKWSKGIVGLIASRITAETGKCSFVISTNDAEYAGSARGVEGYNLVELLKGCEDTLLKYGGHSQAAGYTLKEGALDKFVASLGKVFAETKIAYKTAQNYLTDQELGEIPEELRVYGQVSNIVYAPATELVPSFLQTVWKMDPFGQDFPLPLLLTQVEEYSYRTFGSEQQHIKIESKSGLTLTMFYPKTKARDKIMTRSPLWLLAKPSLNFYRGVLKQECIIDTVL
jgi:single-stranded-DNA-specific exonuclease